MAPAPAWLDHALHWIAHVIELIGVAVIVLGAAAAALRYPKHRRTVGANPAYHAFRADLGRGILLGLEFLVAADIIGTVAVEPTLENLAVLAAIVLIRTFLSFSLEVEIEGYWPWRRAAHGEGDRSPAERT